MDIYLFLLTYRKGSCITNLLPFFPTVVFKKLKTLRKYKEISIVARKKRLEQAHYLICSPAF